jgi:hypothetical protein
MIEETLNERHNTYGVFADLARTTFAIREVIYAELEKRNKVLDPDQLYALEMIIVKIGRLINGDASHEDSWKDIAGYSQLIVDRLNGRLR